MESREKDAQHNRVGLEQSVGHGGVVLLLSV